MLALHSNSRRRQTALPSLTCPLSRSPTPPRLPASARTVATRIQAHRNQDKKITPIPSEKVLTGVVARVMTRARREEEWKFCPE